MANSVLSLPGGYINNTGGPANEFYYFRVNQTQYRPYASVSEACTFVPVAYRSGLTVNIAGVEYWWLHTDTSNAGLILKAAGSTPTPGTGGHVLFDKNGVQIPDTVTKIQFLGDTTIVDDKLNVAGPGAPGGGGDMLKSTYDPNNDGKFEPATINTSAAARFVTDGEKTTWDGMQPTSAKGVANGYAALDSNGRTPAKQTGEKYAAGIGLGFSAPDATTGIITISRTQTEDARTPWIATAGPVNIGTFDMRTPILIIETPASGAGVVINAPSSWLFAQAFSAGQITIVSKHANDSLAGLFIVNNANQGSQTVSVNGTAGSGGQTVQVQQTGFYFIAGGTNIIKFVWVHVPGSSPAPYNIFHLEVSVTPLGV